MLRDRMLRTEEGKTGEKDCGERKKNKFQDRVGRQEGANKAYCTHSGNIADVRKSFVVGS